MGNAPSGSIPDRSSVVTPTSPSHRVDVPHGIESGTDTDAEGDSSRKSSDDSPSPTVPAPPVPPKEYRAKARANELKLDIDLDASAMSHVDSDLDESSPVERTSVATFIAPALAPPIRFSKTGSDFSDFLRLPILTRMNRYLVQQQLVEPMESHEAPGSTASVDRVNGAKDSLEQTIPTTSLQLHDHQQDPSNSPQSLHAEAKDLLSSLSRDFLSRGRSSCESHYLSLHGHGARHERLDSNASLNPNARIVVTSTRFNYFNACFQRFI
ncbi:hypothetical protein EV702DRAFT_1237961 [Suillus placidus]|uniref:Uncharacterized protein n=1 Tax=Suillus placidus TaxID=48579 RepID=A0A9P7D0K2_9AGAM|nr:hypothetical protein EV702DRAFT_1237961 [Suillus placidus]